MPKDGDIYAEMDTGNQYIFRNGDWVKMEVTTTPRGEQMDMTVEQCQKIMARDAITIWEQDQELRQLRRDVANLRRKLLKRKNR